LRGDQEFFTYLDSGDVTITGEGLQNLGLCSALRAFEQGGILIVRHLLSNDVCYVKMHVRLIVVAWNDMIPLTFLRRYMYEFRNLCKFPEKNSMQISDITTSQLENNVFVKHKCHRDRQFPWAATPILKLLKGMSNKSNI
jgi:hypothetical protein